MLVHPNIDPVAFSIGPLAVRWYGLMYLVGFAAGWWLGLRRIAKGLAPVTRQQFDDLLFMAVLGVILGGAARLRAVLQAGLLLGAPARDLRGVAGRDVLPRRPAGRNPRHGVCGAPPQGGFPEADGFVAPLCPLGIAAGRLGNFINGELYGRVTDLPWGMVFRGAGDAPRHPSQLYEFALEGSRFSRCCGGSRPSRARAARYRRCFSSAMACFRFIAEFGREPDSFLGYLAFGLTMGQWLSLPMIALGVWLFARSGSNLIS